MGEKAFVATTNNNGMTLVCLASRQVWPYILIAMHLKPSRLVLLHNQDTDESKRPAQRLKKLFDQQRNIVGPGQTKLELVPHVIWPKCIIACFDCARKVRQVQSTLSSISLAVTS